MKKLLLVLVLVGTIFLSACPSSSVQSPPSPQNIELTVARTLDAVQASIDQAKLLLPTDPTLKDPLNKVIVSYNTARASLLAYHSTQTGDLASLNMQVSQISNEINNLLIQFGGKK